MQLIEGKDALLAACRQRKMKVSEEPANLLESLIQAEGNLDGMEVSLDMTCITGLPGDSQGSITFRGNLTQLLAVLARIWPTLPEVREVVSPGRKSWPDYTQKVEKADS
ncbi:MAG: hypothetical protein ACOY93_10070 [Bacillota bacterium]